MQKVRHNHDALSPSRRADRTLPLLGVFTAGVVVALLLQWFQAQAFGGDWTGLIGVGNRTALAAVIESELGPVATWDGVGHDGQINFGIARDLTGSWLPGVIGEEGYRYRRILYPFLAGLGGSLGPGATLVGLILWSAVGMGLGAVGLALAGRAFGLGRWTWLATILNPGLWLAVQLLMVDALAFGLAAVALGLWLQGSRTWPLLFFALAALTKDQYALLGIVVSLVELSRGRWKSSLRVGLVTGAPLLAWGVIVSLRLGGGLSPEANFDWPFMGVLSSAGSVWLSVAAKDVFYTATAVAGVLIALIGGWLTSHPLLRWIAWSWAGLALIASSGVWDFGNNAARAFAPALTFGFLALQRLRDRDVESRGSRHPSVAMGR